MPANKSIAGLLRSRHFPRNIFSCSSQVSGRLLVSLVSVSIGLSWSLMTLPLPMNCQVIGTMTGLGITLITYLLDKIDVFGAVADERHKFVMDRLEQMMDTSIANSEELVGSIVF